MIVHDLQRFEQVIFKADYLYPFRERAYLEFEFHEPRLTIRTPEGHDEHSRSIPKRAEWARAFGHLHPHRPGPDPRHEHHGDRPGGPRRDLHDRGVLRLLRGRRAGRNFFLAIVVSTLFVGCLGVLLERLCFRPFRGEPTAPLPSPSPHSDPSERRARHRRRQSPELSSPFTGSSISWESPSRGRDSSSSSSASGCSWAFSSSSS